jgi:hypothetical protein
MPGMDGTGPNGTGPFGRGLGPCGAGQAGRFAGRGFRRGGRGVGWLSPTGFPNEDEKSLLEQQKGWLDSRLEMIKKRLEDLGTSEK